MPWTFNLLFEDGKRLLSPFSKRSFLIHIPMTTGNTKGTPSYKCLRTDIYQSLPFLRERANSRKSFQWQGVSQGNSLSPPDLLSFPSTRERMLSAIEPSIARTTNFLPLRFHSRNARWNVCVLSSLRLIIRLPDSLFPRSGCRCCRISPVHVLSGYTPSSLPHWTVLILWVLYLSQFFD